MMITISQPFASLCCQWTAITRSVAPGALGSLKSLPLGVWVVCLAPPTILWGALSAI